MNANSSATAASKKPIDSAESKSLGKLMAKPIVFLICLIPLAVAIYVVVSGNETDPIEWLLDHTGEWALRFLLVTLCATPLMRIFKWPAVARFRRMLGLFAFFYASLHLTVWTVLDQDLDIRFAFAEILDKKFIMFGIIVWFGLLLLAITSNKWSVRKLGLRWKGLHRWVYVLTLFATVHYLWQVKASELFEPTMYLLVLLVLLVWRFYALVK